MIGYSNLVKVERLIPDTNEIKNTNFIDQEVSVEKVKDGDYIKVFNFSDKKMKYIPAVVRSGEFEGTVYHIKYEKDKEIIEVQQFVEGMKLICTTYFDKKKLFYPRIEEKEYWEFGKVMFKNTFLTNEFSELGSQSYRIKNPQPEKIEEWVEFFNNYNWIGLLAINKTNEILHYDVVEENFKGTLYNFVIPQDCAIVTGNNLITGLHE